MIIEDDPFLRNMYLRKFVNSGFEVEEAENGKIGLRKISTFMPDIILLDILMPVMDGFTTLEALKKNPAVNKIPVIMLTNLAQEEDMTEAKEKGASDYIVKSDNRPNALVDKVNAIIGAG